MSGPAELAIVAGAIADAGIKATLVLGLGWATNRLLGHRSAAERHAVWASTLLALPLLPLFAAQRGPTIALGAPWLVGLWAVGFLLATLPMLRGLAGLRHLGAAAEPDPEVPGLRHSDRVTGPLTWGLWPPIILLPTAARDWSPSHRTAALAHERAHITRWDWAVHLGAWGVSALFWFHPLVWLARRELGKEAEHAADDLVLAEGIPPSDYAALLVSLARSAPPAGALGVGSSAVGTRVRAVLATRSRTPRRWPAWTVAVVLSTFALPALGAWPTWTAPEEALTCHPPEILP